MPSWLGSSGDGHSVSGSYSPVPDTSGQTMRAVSRPSRGTGRVLCRSQETGHLSSAFVHSGDGPTTVQEQAPGDPTWEGGSPWVRNSGV